MGQYMFMLTVFKDVFVIKQVLSRYLMCFHSQHSHLENFKCSSQATLRCLAGRTLPRPDVKGGRGREKEIRENEKEVILGLK